MMMDAYGVCPHCGGEGALWIVDRKPLRGWLATIIGKKESLVYRCDECCSKYKPTNTGSEG